MKPAHAIGILVLLIIVIGGAYVLSGQKPANAVPIKIGATLPLTGDLAGIGQSMQRAITIAVDETNKNGGINGRNLTVIFEDDKCDGKESVNTVTKLIAIDGVKAILGPVCSTALLPDAPIVEQNKVILFSGSATNLKITDAGDYIFRDVPSDAFQGKFAAGFIFNSLNKKKVALAFSNEEYGKGLSDVFKAEFGRLGGQVTDTESVERGSTDMRTELIKIKDSKPEVIYFVGLPQDAGNFIKQARELGIDTTIFGSETYDDPQLITIAKDAANGVFYTLPKELTTQGFKDNFNAIFGSGPLIFSDKFYDAAQLIIKSMKACGSDNSDCVKNELYKVKNYQGVSGTITLDNNGDLAQAEYTIKLIVNQTPIVYA